jgi:hypothetical protein
VKVSDLTYAFGVIRTEYSGYEIQDSSAIGTFLQLSAFLRVTLCFFFFLSFFVFMSASYRRTLRKEVWVYCQTFVLLYERHVIWNIRSVRQYWWVLCSCFSRQIGFSDWVCGVEPILGVLSSCSQLSLLCRNDTLWRLFPVSRHVIYTHTNGVWHVNTLNDISLKACDTCWFIVCITPM